MLRLRERWRSLRGNAFRTWSVLSEGAPGFVLFAGLALSALVPWLFGSNLANGIRYAGAMLQVLGILLVAHGLNETRATFGRPTMAARVREWVVRLVTSWRPRTIVFTGKPGGMRLSGSATMSAHSELVGGSLERRVEILEGELRSLSNQVRELGNKTQMQIDTVNGALAAEVRLRNDGDERVQRLVAEIAVGGLHLEWVGLCWLVFATVFSAIPDELAQMIDRLTIGLR